MLSRASVMAPEMLETLSFAPALLCCHKFKCSHLCFQGLKPVHCKQCLGKQHFSEWLQGLVLVFLETGNQACGLPMQCLG
jgi:hypothetical protein